MKNVKLMKTKIQKFFACLLSFAMIFCSLTPTVIKAADSDWNIRLNWGDASEQLGSEYTVNADKDSKYVVKLQVTIEYTGANSKTYAPEEVKINLSDMYDLAGMGVFNSDYLTLDVGAELKGSGSGKGDWYYTKTFNSTTHSNDYVFTNKNTINSSFTSTFQIVFTFDNVREYLKNSFSKSISASLNTGTSVISSNVLKFNYEAQKDTYSLKFREAQELAWPNRILSKIDSDKWDEYIFIDVPIDVEFASIKANALQAGYHLDINFPSDVIYDLYYTRLDNGYMCLFSETDVSKYSSVDTTFDYNELYYSIALPKEKYLQQGILTLEAKWYGTYIAETEEELVAQDTISINVNDFNYVYSGELYSSSKDKYKGYLFREAMQYGYGKDLIGGKQEWELGSQAVYYGNSFNMILGDDLQYYIYEDNTFRQLQDDERVIDSIKIYNPISTSIDYEVWVKPVGSDTYMQHTTGTLAKSSTTKTVSLVSTSDRYSEVYVRYLNINETVVQGDYLDVITRFYDNVTLDGGKVITDCYNLSYVKIEMLNDDLSVKETVVMDDLGVTNIPGLAEAVNVLDHADGDTKLRATDSISVSSCLYRGDTYFYDALRGVTVGAEYINLTTGAIANYINNDSQLATSIDNYVISYEYPSILTLDEDKIKFSKINTDDPHPTFYSIEEIEALENVKITYTITDIGNGKNQITFNVDTSNLTTPYVSTEDDVYLHSTCLDFFISIDDYYLLDLEGKEAIFKATNPVSDKIYNAVVDMYYKTSGSGTATFYIEYPSVARNSYQGIQKLLSVDGGEYTTEVQKTNNNESYSYKLRISSSETQMTNIVLYDQIENEETSGWKGIFQGYSFDTLTQAGIDTSKFKVYYSSNRSQTQDITASGWVLASSWTQDLSAVKSIAFDMKGYVLSADSAAYVEVFMKAPSSSSQGEYVKNKATASYVEYDINDKQLSTPLKTTANLPSNITSLVLGDAKINVNVTKKWNDNNNSLSLRPESVTVRLYQNGIEVQNATLNQSNSWKTTFSNMPKFDSNFVQYEYTVKEDMVPAYKNAISSTSTDKTIDFTVTNSIDENNAYLNISGTKTWNDKDNAYNSRPNSITINLLRNGTKINSVTTNASNNWEYSFEKLPKYAGAGIEYEYDISEEYVSGYSAKYSKEAKTGGLKLTFSNESETENVRYDYVQIIYEKNGAYYQAAKLGGTDISGAEVKIPTTDFYLYWNTDSSQDAYYGYRIASVELYTGEIAGGSSVTLPSSTVIETKILPESLHGNYGNKLSELYHYDSGLTVNDQVINISNTYEYVDIKGTKIWNDNDDAAGLRPDSVTVNLLRDGTKINSVSVNELGQWKYTFEGLPKYDYQGNEYTYMVKEEIVNGYTASYETKDVKGIRLIFSEDSATEGSNYDYVQIIYKKDGQYYQAAKLGGKGTSNTIANAVVDIPTTDFYLYWKTDYSNSSYYGFKINSIEALEEEVVEGSSVSLPSSDIIETNVLPESVHGDYGNSIAELYHYTSDFHPQQNIINTLENPNRELTLGKTVYVDDIWWAHGNPTFIIKVEGRDVFNNEVIKYVSVEFDEAYVNQNKVGSGAQSTVTKKTTMKLAPGNYTVSEVQVLRYDLTKIDATNSSATTNTAASFDLKTNNSGECIFTNRCVDYHNYSHNDIVINSIGD